MPMRWTRWGLLGQDVYDADGTPVGRVVDTYPFVGGTVEMAVVRLAGQFGTKRLLSLDTVWFDDYGLRTPYSVWQGEGSPALSDGRHAPDDPQRPRRSWGVGQPPIC